MKNHPLLVLLLLAASAVAEPPPSVITIKVQIIETDARTGKEDVLSAPTVATRPGQKATIEVGREMTLAPFDDDKELRQSINTGVELTVTPQERAGDIVLMGRVTVRENDSKTSDGSALAFKTREVVFAAAVADGAQKEFKLEPVNGRALTLRLTASKKEMKNAAVTYWQAFAALPKLDDAQRKLIDPKSADTGEAVRALVEQSNGALDLLVKASSEDFCAWDLDLTQGPDTKLPQIAPAQTLSRLALLRARLRVADGDAAGALDDRLAALRLASDTSRPALLICRLVGIAIETPVLEALASQLPALDGGQRARVASQLRLLDHVPTMAECVTTEAGGMSDWMRSELDAEIKTHGEKFDAGQWVGRLINSMSGDTKPVADGQKLRFRTADEARKLIDGCRAGMLELAKVTELPFAEFEPAAEKFYARYRSEPRENILLFFASPPIQNVRVKELQAQTRLALLRAAIEVQAKGETALPAELATHRKTERGFELTSKALFDGKAVVLVVGGR